MAQKHNRNQSEFDRFMSRTLNAFPWATVDQDNAGQLVVYTGLMEDADGNIVPFVDPDEALEAAQEEVNGTATGTV